ncbi:hypothetical protein [Undibacterium sp. Ji49W]|uniref:hypothetical protein n=1 Tax=Undibacterium sp. Ji49W TaxID=3413040 RepID=UPI003BF26AD2
MLLENFNNLVKEYAIWISILTFLVGLLVGNWQAIGRDKRKEFNELTDLTFADLTKCVNNRTIYSSEIDVARIGPYLSFFDRFNFTKYVKKQRELINSVQTYNVETSKVSIDPVGLKNLIFYQKKILSYLKRR